MRLVSQSSVTPPALFGGRITGLNSSGPITPILLLSSQQPLFSVFFFGVFSFLDCINGENIIFCSGLSKLIGFFLFWTGLMVKILYFVLVFPVFFLGVFSFLDCINGENIIFRTGLFFGIFSFFGLD